MDKLKTALLLFMVPLLCYAEARRSKSVYTVDINERGTHFNESVEVNNREKTVLYTVPAHNDVDQSQVLFDYKTGYFATRIPKLKECLIQHIPKDQSSLERVRESLQLQREIIEGDKSVIPVNTVIAATVKERKINPSKLNQRFLAFCGDYEAYEVKEIFHQAFDLKGNGTNGKIRKRKALELSRVQIVSMKIDVWVRTKRNSAKWVKLTLNTCRKLMQYAPDLEKGGCDEDADSWEYHCGAKTNTCIYYVKCRLEDDNASPSKKKVRCLEKHYYTGWTCCKVQCP